MMLTIFKVVARFAFEEEELGADAFSFHVLELKLVGCNLRIWNLLALDLMVA